MQTNSREGDRVFFYISTALISYLVVGEQIVDRERVSAGGIQ